MSTWIGKEGTLPWRVRSAILDDSKPRFSSRRICPIEGNFKITALEAILGYVLTRSPVNTICPGFLKPACEVPTNGWVQHTYESFVGR